MATIVQFARGPRAAYEIYSAEEKARKIYFAQDTNEILVNGIAYGLNLKSLDLDLISSVTTTAPGQFVFTNTNGKSTTIDIPVATESSNGLLSKEDKIFIDTIPDVYATKEDIKSSIARLYRYKGTKQYYSDLPTEGMEIGDTYNIVNSFTIADVTYPAGVNVAWNGDDWDPLGGEDTGYSKAEADEKFIKWTLDGDRKLLFIPKGGKIIGIDNGGSGMNLMQLGIYQNGTIQQVEVGSAKYHLCLNSIDRPNLDMPNGVKQDIAFLSDIGQIDLSKYPEGSTMEYLPTVTQEYTDANGFPDRIDGKFYDIDTNRIVYNIDYIKINYLDGKLNKYDLYTATKVIPNATYEAIRKALESKLVWEEAL